MSTPSQTTTPSRRSAAHGARRVLQVHLEPHRTGAANMLRDRQLLESHDPASPPVLRLYSWSPPAISLGHMQSAATALDLDACRRDAIDVVKRPTGGRAILHAEEITYALIGAVRDPLFAGDLRATHRVVGECLVATLAHLGVTCELSRPARDPQRRLLHQPCFASAGRAEILVAGRKLLGSAQRRNATTFLQHGSLLIGPKHEDIALYVRPATEADESDVEFKDKLRDKMRAGTTNLTAIQGRSPQFETLADAFIRGFTSRLGLLAQYDDAPTA